jgi:hypothetical protein
MGIFHGSRDKSFIIKRPKSDKWPVHMGSIYVRGEYLKKHQDYIGKAPDNLSFGELIEWGMHVFKREKDGFNGGLWNSGKYAHECWEQLRRWAKTSGTVWLWGWKIWPAWCLLEGTKEVSEGRLILDIREKDDKAPGGGVRPRRAEGLFIAEDPPTIICLAVPGGGRIKIVDLANYGIEPEDFGVDGPAGALCATVHAVKEYVRLCKTYDLGSCQTTAASQAWYCYRRSHMLHQVTVNPMEKVLALEQAAYYGGRCECARIGRFRQKLYHLDVNSMYTSLGLFSLFPVRHCSTWMESDGTHPPLPSHMKVAIADVTVRTLVPCLPAREGVKLNHDAVPMRRSGRERVIYPVGTFRTALAGEEIQLAYHEDLIQRWHRIQYYDAAPLMESWSKWAIRMRASLDQNGFRNLARCAKKIMNSLPGKWGQRLKRWVDFDTKTALGRVVDDAEEWYQEWGKHPVNEEITPYRTIAGQTQYQDREELAATSCPSIAAFWTAAGRVFLQGSIFHCGAEHVYYYDTDSMIVDQEGFSRMQQAGYVDQVYPGRWKLKETSDDVEILGIRRYRFGHRWCVAGPYGGAIDGTGTPGEFTAHEGFGAQLWHRSVGDAVEIKRQAKWRKEYHHGTVDKDGIVWPFFVGNALSPEKNVIQ